MTTDAPADPVAPPVHREHARVVLRHATSTPGAARRFTRNHLCAAHAADALDAVLVVVSELVTNAVEHGQPPVVLTLICNVEQVVVGVHDSSTTEPRRTEGEVPWYAESGRGMQLVEGLSVHWGVSDEGPGGGTGKGVWATITLDPA
ncbi:ATP-binding protein [Quadrisphaera setariae]|uniref:ATP-binding protein n=1 Tax=Quadrisphaera setariae TaxID=2593304 RepID=UPI001650CA3D|nr:ATP-binding protein [Quadrisphaera setariae]